MNASSFIYCLLLVLAFLVTGCGSERVSTTTRQQFGSTNPAVRYRATEELTINESAEATQLLMTALGDTNRGVRMVAAESLGKRQAKEATDKLISLLRDDDMWVRSTAADALGEMGAKKATKPLIELLEETLAKEPKTHTTFDWGQDANSAAFALKRITGKDFAFDTSKWEKWLAEEGAQTQ